MQTISYSRNKLIISAVVFAGLAWFGLTLGQGIWLVLPIFLIAGSIASLIKLAGDRVAVEYDRNTVTIRSLWGRRTLPWTDVVSVSVLQRTYRTLGIIPVGRYRFLTFRVKGGVLGTKKVQLPFLLLEPGSSELAVQVDAMQRLSLGEAPGAPVGEVAARRTPDSIDRGSDFDPDAVMARYLAGRVASIPSTAPAAAPANLPLMPGAPPRATFGRKRG